MRVRAYRNLHRNCISVMCFELGSPHYGKVIAHEDEVNLHNVNLIVSKAGQARVRATGQKNVHAFVQGQWLQDGGEIPQGPRHTIRYNPYETDTWQLADGTEVHGVIHATVTPTGVTATI